MRWMTNTSTREEVEARASRRNCIILRWNAYSHSFDQQHHQTEGTYRRAKIPHNFFHCIGEEHPLTKRNYSASQLLLKTAFKNPAQLRENFVTYR